MAQSHTSSAAALKELKECERKIQKSLKSPTVRFLREQFEKAGCPIGDNFIKAAHCNEARYAGGYIPGQGIVVCSNGVKRQDEITGVIIHELIHAFDQCRAANMNWNNCAHQACSEIRANRLSGDCHFKRELLRGFLRIRGHEPECIKRRVMKSLSANPYCSGAKGAKDSMESVWDVCYNDTEPFEKAP